MSLLPSATYAGATEEFWAQAGSAGSPAGVTRILAGTGITVFPESGVGEVQITATGGGGGGVIPGPVIITGTGNALTIPDGSMVAAGVQSTAGFTSVVGGSGAPASLPLGATLTGALTVTQPLGGGAVTARLQNDGVVGGGLRRLDAFMDQAGGPQLAFTNTPTGLPEQAGVLAFATGAPDGVFTMSRPLSLPALTVDGVPITGTSPVIPGYQVFTQTGGADVFVTTGNAFTIRVNGFSAVTGGWGLTGSITVENASWTANTLVLATLNRPPARTVILPPSSTLLNGVVTVNGQSRTTQRAISFAGTGGDLPNLDYEIYCVAFQTIA